MKHVWDKARELMQGQCRVCPQCNGRACAGQVPGMGGLGTGSSFMDNYDALAAIKLNLRTIHQAHNPELNCEFLGTSLSMPVMASPIGGVSFNMSEQVSERDYAASYALGCRRAGILPCFGDGVREEILQSAYAAMKLVDDQGVIFFKPWEQGKLLERIAQLSASKTPMAGIDIDAAGLITLALMGNPVAPKTSYQLRELVEHLKIPFIVKGVMTPDEARLAVEAGARAIVVSNHGGRVLDHAPGTARVLPAIAAEVKGRIKIMVDGAVRSGADVLKMLALGADVVMIGRPIAIAALGGGAEGVASYLDKIKNELTSAMIMTGCSSIADISPRVLFNFK